MITVMHGRNLQDGEVLTKEGDQDDTLFILTKGIINVCNNINGRNEVVYAMKVGECAGIRAFVEGTPRLATLMAQGPATVYTIKPADFEKLLETYPKQGYNFMRGMFRVLHLNLMRMNAETRQLVSYISKTGGRY
ncbi:MAG: cyclic nucleotide-binding domain-containing protein [Pseudomonadota bacterium]